MPKSKLLTGFAMVEVLVVISIITVLVAVTITNFPKIRSQLALSRATYIFAENVRKTQQMALSAVPYRDSLGAEQEINGYGVYVDLIDLGNKKYIIYADKSLGNKEYDSLDYVIEIIDFSSSEDGVIIKEINSVFSNQVSINFGFPKIEVSINQLNQGQNNVEVVFALESDQTKTKSFLVSTSGLIEVK